MQRSRFWIWLGVLAFLVALLASSARAQDRELLEEEGFDPPADKTLRPFQARGGTALVGPISGPSC